MANTSSFEVVSAKNANFEPSSVLKAMPERSVDVAAQRADPALLGDHDGDRLALDQRLLDRGLVVLGRLGEGGAALAERGLRPELVAHLLDLRRRPSSTAAVSDPISSLSALRSVRRSLSSVLISISSSLRRLRSRMLRMASACTSVSLKVFIRTGFGSSSLRMILMTLSRLR